MRAMYAVITICPKGNRIKRLNISLLIICTLCPPPIGVLCNLLLTEYSFVQHNLLRCAMMQSMYNTHSMQDVDGCQGHISR